jgi:glyoxylase-like metal-dependent hydrolase (beta-lactamase superfamily II)
MPAGKPCARYGVLAAILATLGSPEIRPGAGIDAYLKARKVLDLGVQALGGEEALRATRTVRREVSGDWYGSGQGPRPERFSGPTLTPPRSNGRSRITSFIDYDGGRWLEQAVESDFAGDSITRVTAAAEDLGFETITYRAEKPFYRTFADPDLRALRTGRLRRHPEGLLRMALDRPETLEWVGEEDVSGRRQQIISFTDTLGTRILLYFDAPTHRMTRSEILRSHPIAGDSSSDVVFDDYRKAGALMLPFHTVDRRAGVPVEAVRASTIEVNGAFPEERLRPPLEFARMVEDPAEQSVEDLGGGLYLIRGPYNTLFAAFRDHVVVFEAPVSSAYSGAGLERVRATVPDKPIRFLVSTHFHFDHVAGVRTYVAEDVPVVTTPDAKGVIERVVSARHTMHPDRLSAHPRAARIETVTRQRVFDDGANRAELHDFGPTEHCAQILAAYFPRQKVLFVPDLWDIISTEQLIAGADAVSMARKIRDLGLEVERVIPVHGAPGTMPMLRRALAARAKYFPEEGAVGKGGR